MNKNPRRINFLSSLLPVFFLTLLAVLPKKYALAQENTEWIVINHDGVKVEALVDKPTQQEVDLLLAFHGTASDDTKIRKAAEAMLSHTKKILGGRPFLIVSVAYPEEGLLMGDNLRECAAALLWAKEKAAQELGYIIRKIYLIGHSQGGYIVTRLNVMHETDGVIANGPGPLNLTFRCRLDERGKVRYKDEKNKGNVCRVLKEKYGSVFDHPQAYDARSLMSFTCGYKSRILFIQGLQDDKIQMTWWPKFKEKVEQCENNAPCLFLEIPKAGHKAAFEDPAAIAAIQDFLNS